MSNTPTVPDVSAYTDRVNEALNRATAAIEREWSPGPEVAAARNSLRDHVGNFRKAVDEYVATAKRGATVRERRADGSVVRTYTLLPGDTLDVSPVLPSAAVAVGAAGSSGASTGGAAGLPLGGPAWVGGIDWAAGSGAGRDSAAYSGPIIMGDFSTLCAQATVNMLSGLIGRVRTTLEAGTKRDASMACWAALQAIEASWGGPVGVGNIKAVGDKIAALEGDKIAAMNDAEKMGKVRDEQRARAERAEKALASVNELRWNDIEAAARVERENRGLKDALGKKNKEAAELRAENDRLQRIVPHTTTPDGMLGGAGPVLPLPVAIQVADALDFYVSYNDNGDKARNARTQMARFYDGAKQRMPAASEPFKPSPESVAKPIYPVRPTHIRILKTADISHGLLTDGCVYEVSRWEGGLPFVRQDNGGGSCGLNLTTWEPA